MTLILIIDISIDDLQNFLLFKIFYGADDGFYAKVCDRCQLLSGQCYFVGIGTLIWAEAFMIVQNTSDPDIC